MARPFGNHRKHETEWATGCGRLDLQLKRLLKTTFTHTKRQSHYINSLIFTATPLKLVSWFNGFPKELGFTDLVEPGFRP